MPRHGRACACLFFVVQSVHLLVTLSSLAPLWSTSSVSCTQWSMRLCREARKKILGENGGVRGLAALDAMVVDAFTTFDFSGNGEVSRDELRAGLKYYRVAELNEMQLTAVFEVGSRIPRSLVTVHQPRAFIACALLRGRAHPASVITARRSNVSSSATFSCSYVIVLFVWHCSQHFTGDGHGPLRQH